MSWVAWLGLAMVAVSGLGVLCVLLVFVLPAGLRLRRVALVTQDLVAGYRSSVGAELWEAHELALERALLLRPLRRIRRVVTHPLVVALLESYSRRRARARSLGSEA